MARKTVYKFHHDGKYYTVQERYGWNNLGDDGWRITFAYDPNSLSASQYAVNEGPLHDAVMMWLRSPQQYADMGLEEWINKLDP